MIFFPVQAFEPARRAGRLPLDCLMALGISAVWACIYMLRGPFLNLAHNRFC